MTSRIQTGLRELLDVELERLTAVVEAHDGTAEQLAEATKAARISVIFEAAKALGDSAKLKRLAGKPCSADELAALVDLSLFG